MLKLAYVSLLLQLTAKIRANTLPPYLQTYWKTTYVTDKAPDYWNHGLVYVPGLSIGPKLEDILPAWLAKIESSSTNNSEQYYYEYTDMQDQTTEMIPISTDSTTITTDKEAITNATVTAVQNISVTVDSTTVTAALESTVNDDKKQNKTESSVAPTTETIQLPMKAFLEEVVPVIRAIEGETSTDPFSAFFRKIIIVLATKALPDLQYLIKQFNDYVSMLLTSGQLGRLGLATNSYIATRLLILDSYPMDALREYFSKLQSKLANRTKEFPEDVNNILNYMDDTYDETEEDAMQAVLREAVKFPNTKNYNKVAQGFVDYVFLKPMLRVAGTSRGNVLFEMIQKAIINHNNVVRKSTAKPRLLKVFRPVRSRVTENSRHYRRNFKITQKLRRESSDTKTEEDTSSRRKNEDKEKSFSKDYSSSESSEWTSSSDVKEGSIRIIRKNNPLKNKKHKKSRHAGQRISRKNKLRILRSKYTKQYRPHTLYWNGTMTGRYDNKEVLETTIENSGIHLNATESSNVETLLKAIYGTFRSKHNGISNTLTTVKYRDTGVVNEQRNNGNYDIKRLIRRSVYKLAKKAIEQVE